MITCKVKVGRNRAVSERKPYQSKTHYSSSCKICRSILFFLYNDTSNWSICIQVTAKDPI